MKSRIAWIDIAKGIAIFLMVIGHTSIPDCLAKWIWSFHMPFFFFISGLLFNEVKYGNFTYFFISRARSLVIPYILITSVVMILLWCIDEFNERELYLGWDGYPLWFVPVLFMAEILACSFILIVRKCRFKTRIIVPCIFMLILSGYIMSVKFVRIPFKVETVPLATAFYLCGWLAKKLSVGKTVDMRMLVIFVILHVIMSQLLPKTDMCFNIYGSLLNVLNALIGIGVLSGISIIIENKFKLKFIIKALEWGGQNTLCIMGFASIIIMLMNVLLNCFTIPGYITSPIKHILLWAILYGLTIMLNNYFPMMLGKRKRDE